MNRKEFGGTPSGQFRKGWTVATLDERLAKEENKTYEKQEVLKHGIYGEMEADETA